MKSITKARIAYELQKDTPDWRTPWEMQDYLFVATELVILFVFIIICLSVYR